MHYDDALMQTVNSNGTRDSKSYKVSLVLRHYFLIFYFVTHELAMKDAFLFS